MNRNETQNFLIFIKIYAISQRPTVITSTVHHQFSWASWLHGILRHLCKLCQWVGFGSFLFQFPAQTIVSGLMKAILSSWFPLPDVSKAPFLICFFLSWLRGTTILTHHQLSHLELWSHHIPPSLGLTSISCIFSLFPDFPSFYVHIAWCIPH